MGPGRGAYLNLPQIEDHMGEPTLVCRLRKKTSAWMDPDGFLGEIQISPGVLLNVGFSWTQE